MKLLRRRKLSLQKLTIALGSLSSLWLFSYLTGAKMPWDASVRYSGLDYTDKDSCPEALCNCSAIMRGDREAVEQAKLLSLTKDFRNSTRIPNDYYINANKDCRQFKLSRKYLTFPLSQEEEDFPLAYSIVVHDKVQNFERLLRAIYAPQNIYCIHVDKKSDQSVLSAIKGIASCFPNIFMVSQPVSVVYASWSRVQADLNCMADLYNASTKWKYFINLCGQDFPLKTNLEIVQKLRSLMGGNNMESERMPVGKLWRVKNSHHVVDGKIQSTGEKKEPPPHNMTLLSGNAYMVASRGYIQSVLQDEEVQNLMNWAKDTYSPDEFLWATIQRMSGVPGSTWIHPKYDLTDVMAITRLVKWYWHEGPRDSLKAAYQECHGTHVRGICVYGAGDLQWMLEKHHLFANKFDLDRDPIPVYCLEKHLRKRALAALSQGARDFLSIPGNLK